jgi:OFA family oxalate/formate antiporter-like MFS transporter
MIAQSIPEPGGNMLRNRWFQLVASVIAMIMIANLQYAWNLFNEPIRKATNWKLSDIQWAVTLFLFVQTFAQPAQGWIIDRMGPRILITIGGLLVGVGWTSLAYADSLMKLYVFYAIAGIGAASVYSGCISAALKWFPDRRGFAAGIIAAGFGGGSVLTIAPIGWIIQKYNYGSAFVVTGVIQGLILMVTAQVLRKPPADFAVKAAAPGQAATRQSREQFTTAEMLRTGRFYLMYVMFVMAVWGGLTLNANAGSLAKEWNISNAMFLAASSLFPAANAVSRIFWGWASERTGRENAMVVAFILQAGFLMSVPLVGHLSGIFFVASLMLVSFTWGASYSVFPATIGDYFGSRNAASNYSFVYTAKGVASLGIFLAPWVREQFGTWSATFYASALLVLISGLLAFLLRSLPLPKKKTYAAAQEMAASRGV